MLQWCCNKIFHCNIHFPLITLYICCRHDYETVMPRNIPLIKIVFDRTLKLFKLSLRKTIESKFSNTRTHIYNVFNIYFRNMLRTLMSVQPLSSTFTGGWPFASGIMRNKWCCQPVTKEDRWWTHISVQNKYRKSTNPESKQKHQSIYDIKKTEYIRV